MSSGAAAGLIESAKQVIGILVAIVENRLALLATDLHEARTELMTLLLVGAFAVFCFGLAIVLAALFVVAVFWDTYRLTAIGALTALFAVAGVGLWRSAAHQARTANDLFYATRAELQKDRERLRGRSD